MSTLLPSESHSRSSLNALANGWSFVAVRDALRSGDGAGIDRAVAPLYRQCIAPLERFAANLIRKGEAVGLSIGKDSDDIAVEAFDRVFTLVVGENGGRIRDEVHFLRTLFRAARCIWVDALRLPDTRRSRPRSDNPGMPDEPVSRSPLPEAALFGSGKTALVALRLLFTDSDRIGQLFRKCGAGTRHFRQYQALALYELGERVRDDLEDTDGEAGAAARRFWRQLSVGGIGIAPRDWSVLEAAAISCVAENPDAETRLYEPIRVAVRTVCGVDLQNRDKRYVLRYEMGRMLAACRTEIETMGWE